MIIRKATVYGFGHLINCEFVPDKRGILNVTKGLITDTDLFFEFVRTMLYGHSLRNGISTRQIYMPDEQIDSRGKKVLYGGELIYDACGRNYRLSCFYGKTKQEDVYRIIDTVSGRDVKIDAGKTVGEKTLHISEGAFISAAKDFGYEAVVNGDWSLSLGKLSSLLGVFDNRCTPKEFKLKLSEKLLTLTNPKTKTGSFDLLVIKKMSMKNTLARISDRDGKLIKLRNELEQTERDLASIDAEINDNSRLFGLYEAAKTLLNKDKIMALYTQILGVMRQLDFAEAEHRRLVKTRLLPKLILPGISFLAGCFMVFLGVGVFKGGVYGLPSEILGAGLALVGIALGAWQISKHTNRFTLKTDGRITTYAEEAERLKAELFRKNGELLDLLGDNSAGEILNKWRESEDVMRSAQDNERRFAVMKQAYDLEVTMNMLNAKKKPLTDKISAIHSEIDSITSTGDMEFGQAVFELEGLDEKIKKLQDEIDAVKIALSAADIAENRFVADVVVPVCRSAEEIYFKTLGERAEFNIDPDYNIVAKCSDKELALLSLRGALSAMASSESDRQLLFIDNKAGEKPYLDRYMRASGIGQLVVVSPR